MIDNGDPKLGGEEDQKGGGEEFERQEVVGS